MTEELGRLYGSLEHMAFTDPLTNLPNRARFHDSLAESTRRHARKQAPFALLLMDLDRFKSVNDSLGHQVGDLLLQDVSLRLKSVLRESDTITRLVDDDAGSYGEKMVARLGGDEFAAILPGVTTLDTAASIARKLLTVMQAPFVIRGHRLSIGMSIGIALYPEHGEDIDVLMQRADAAMYSAKHSQSGFAFAETMQQEQLL
jgi:diguanylate cyclase (GGDEF)-like protein